MVIPTIFNNLKEVIQTGVIYMLKVIKLDKRKYQMIREIDSVDEELFIFNLDFSPIANKYEKLIEMFEDCSVELGTDFDNWYVGFLSDYIKNGYDYAVIRDNIPKLMEFSDAYLEKKDIKFEDYINRSKVSKNSIFFDETDIKKIIQVSNYLKLYFLFCQDSKLKLPNKFHKEVYNILVERITEGNIVYKLFKIVSSKTYEYNHTDKYMWDYIKAIYCKTTDVHIMSIFNFLMNNILVTCSTQQNPIPYLISVIDESIKWILKNIYKDAIIYSDTIATQDVYTVQGKDNLKTYAHNDTIGRLLVIAYNKLEDAGITDIEKFKTTTAGLKEASLFANYVTYPILSKILDIPYRHFLTIPVSNSYLLNVLLYCYLPDEFKKEYKVLNQMLLFFNTEKPISKTTYKIKSIPVFLSTNDSFLSFKNYYSAYDTYSSIIGKLSRNTYISFLNSKEITNFPLAKLETDVIRFYNDYFSGRLDELLSKVGNEIDDIL